MTRLINSPPEAYEPPVPPEVRHTIQLGDPFGPETPEQAEARAMDIYQRSLTGELGPNHQAVVQAEAVVYGFAPKPSSVPALLETRRAKIAEYDQLLRTSFNELAPVIAEDLARDVAEEGEDPESIRAMLQARLDGVWTQVQDPLLKDDEDIALGEHSAGLDYMTGAVEFNYAALVTAQATRGIALAPGRKLFDRTAGHEGLQAALARWADADAEDPGSPLTNGIDLMNGHGEWINEGTIEKYRVHRLGGTGIAYEGAVVALAVADALDPEFERARLRAAVLNEGHGAMIGRLEGLFGPDAPNIVGQLIEAAASIEDISGFKSGLIGLLPEGLRERGAQAFDEELLWIFDPVERHRQSGTESAR